MRLTEGIGFLMLAFEVKRVNRQGDVAEEFFHALSSIHVPSKQTVVVEEDMVRFEVCIDVSELDKLLNSRQEAVRLSVYQHTETTCR